MRYGIFVSNAGHNSGGPEVFESELLKSLAKLDRNNEFHIFCLHRNAESVIGVKQDNFFYHTLRPRIRHLSMTFDLYLKLAKLKPTVFHAPVIPPLFTPSGYIFTLVCSTTMKYPELYPPMIRLRLKTLVHRAIRKAQVVLTVSDDVKHHTIEAFGLAPEKFKTVYLGVSPNFQPLGQAECEETLIGKYGIRNPYFLYSGRWEKRKNLFRILRAFARFKRDFKTDYKMVFTGGRSWLGNQVDLLVQELGIHDDFIDAGKSPFEDLPPLYAGASALVYPSLWEGFGMPIVEAMACGTPVITSNLSSMPEIAGNAALLVDPTSEDEIYDAMYKISRDQKLCDTLSARGLMRAKLFNWEETARQTLQVYQQIAKSVPSI